ncbi:MAG: hypothetical protein J7L07_06950, partial [Candidatus Odinarchaeota archaeon]|nr:hypothetical protein [Candidatus Odinarchaeota archaeon]
MFKSEHLTKTLFIISCSATKDSQYEEDKKWEDIIHLVKYSRFQEFTSIRKELMNFYSSIQSN